MSCADIDRLEQSFLRQKNRDVGIVQHERNTLSWIGGIHGNVSAASLHHTQQGDDHVQRTLDEHANHHARFHAGASQVVGQLVGTAVEFAVGQLFVLERGRDCVRRLAGLGFKQLMDTEVTRIVGCGLIPIDSQLAACSFVEQRQTRYGLVRILDHAQQQRFAMFAHQAFNRDSEQSRLMHSAGGPIVNWPPRALP